MSDAHVKVAIADKDGCVRIITLSMPSELTAPSAKFIAAYLDELGYERNGYVVQKITAAMDTVDYIAAVNSANRCASQPFKREKLEDAAYLAFVGLAD